MAEFTKDWHSWNIESWEKHLAKFKGKPTRALEIGSFEGRSTVWLLQNILNHINSGIVCIDPFEQTEEYKKLGVCETGYLERFKKNIEPFKEKVFIIAKRSEDVVWSKLTNKFHIVYVDGGHTAPQCLFDMVMSWNLLFQGGIMIVDDYEWDMPKLPETEKPKLAIDSFLDICEGKYKILHKGYQVILEKL